MFHHTIQINLTTDQLGEIIQKAVRSELAIYTPPAPEGSDLPELLTRRQTAEHIGVSLTTLHEWAQDTDD